MLYVLCATAGERQPQGLEHAPAHTYWEDTRKGWAAAANALLDHAADAGADALFIDDDITLLPETFADIDQWRADDTLVGFKLLDGGRVVSAGHMLTTGGLLLPNPNPAQPCYLAHVTASAMWIPHAVLAAGVRFPDWPGVHGEDVAFTLDVWMHGFKVLYWPSPVLHALAPNGIGLTKANERDLGPRLLENARMLGKWTAERRAELGRVPLGLQSYETKVLT